MARGVAVVAVNSGGPGEYIRHQETGMLASSGDPGALADALEPLLVSPDLRKSLAQAGRAQFLEEFTEKAMRDRFFHFLEAIAQTRNQERVKAAAS
jgi:glycosyltransferase involved in cell wall biosynthesis